jgi:hypothetical protein
MFYKEGRILIDSSRPQSIACIVTSSCGGQIPKQEFEMARKATKKATKKAAKKTAKRRTRVEYTKADVKELRAHSKARTPVSKIVKAMKRSEGSLRQKALNLGIGLGHRR